MLKTVHQDPQWKDDSTQSSPRGARKFVIILRRNCSKILCFLRKKTFQKRQKQDKKGHFQKGQKQDRKGHFKNRNKQDKKAHFKKGQKDKNRAVVTLTNIPATQRTYSECS